MTKPYINEKVLNAVRCYHWRRHHRQKCRNSTKQWNEKHPERRKKIANKWARNNKQKRKESLDNWRKKNPDKVKAQQKRTQKRRYQRRYHYQQRKGIVVAVTCLVCNDLVIGQRWGEKLYCPDCKKKACRKIPRSIIEQLTMHPSFSEMSRELKIWKTIKELREAKKYSMPI